MNEDILKGKWHMLQGDVKKKWGQLTNDDLTVISGEREKLMGILQTKYGYKKEQAEKEYEEFLHSHKK